jgi:hypothetical protein
MVLSPPPPNVCEFKDYLTTSKMWVIILIPPPTYWMGNNKEKKHKPRTNEKPNIIQEL